MDLRDSLNAISDVIVNRPPPLREFDQIYMKAADMLIQTEHISKWVHERDLVFVGDGDALALCLVHLHREGHLTRGPRTVHVLDFDERMVNSVRRFAERHGYEECITSSLYNVADALPAEQQGRYGAFYTNPPFGGSNGGASVRAFLGRGVEACRADAVCCAVLADYSELSWCKQVLQVAQSTLLEKGFMIAEMVPGLHTYHLDDEPDLTSCSLIAAREHLPAQPITSVPLSADMKNNFYGRGVPLTVKYVKDKTNGGKLASRDHWMEKFEDGGEKS